MQLNLSDQSSIYLQIAQMVEDNILRNIYCEEEQVPSTNELARIYNINPATAAKGLNLLVAEGVLYKRRGVGMFVSPDGVKLVQSKRKTAFYNHFMRSLVKESRTLGLTNEELMDMMNKAIAEGES